MGSNNGRGNMVNFGPKVKSESQPGNVYYQAIPKQNVVQIN